METTGICIYMSLQAASSNIIISIASSAVEIVDSTVMQDKATNNIWQNHNIKIWKINK